MLYLAIDQHCKQLTMTDRNEAGDATIRRQVSTEWEAMRAFFADYVALSQKEGGFVAIVEVCGFNKWLLEMLGDYGCKEIFLVQPDKRSKKKTDRRDANSLAEILWINRERLLAGKPVQGLRRIHPPTEVDAEARQITEIRKRAGQQRTRVQNRIRHLLRKHNLKQEYPTKNLDTVKGRAWLEQREFPPMDRLEMDLLLAQWKLWNEQIEILDAEIKKRQREDARAAALATIPGCGAYGSLALSARVGDVRRFPRPASLANYWGLTPSCRNSGETKDRLGSITKQGSATARFILGQMVLHVLHRDCAIKAWYGRIKRRRGSKIARVAVMRRLATIIWHILKHEEPYMIGGPPRRKLPRKEMAPRPSAAARRSITA
jgi:transposase